MYRERIYKHYVSGREQPLAPDTPEGLSPRKAYLLRLIRNYFPKDFDSEILELGCGHGALVYFAILVGYHKVFGVDASQEQVAAAHHLGIGTVRQGDVFEELKSSPDETYGAVIAFDVIEHLNRNELFALVDEVRRVLKKGGRFIVHVPNAESPFFGRVRYGDLSHEMAFTTTSIDQVFLSSGYSSVACYEDQPVVHGVKSAMRWTIWRMIRGCLRLYLVAETGSNGRGAIFSQNLLAIAIK